MNLIKTYFTNSVTEAFGWTFVHSLWQGVVALIIVLAAMFIFRKHKARIKYFIAYTGLIAMLAASVVTFTKSYKYAQSKAQLLTELSETPVQLIERIQSSISENKTNNELVLRDELKRIKIRAFLQKHFPVIFFLWFLGIMVLLFRTAFGFIQLFRYRTQRLIPVQEELEEYFSRLLTKLKIKRKVSLFSSALAKVPLVVGHVKPYVLLPFSVMSGLSTKEIEAILAHELAHIKRNDYLLNILQTIIETVFFYHPAIWFINNIIRNERENACDDTALELTKDQVNYAKALARTEEMVHYGEENLAVAFTKKRGGLLYRIKRITNNSKMKKTSSEGFVVTTLIFISLLLFSFSFDGVNAKYTQPHSAPAINETAESTIKFIPESNVIPEPRVASILSNDSIQKHVEFIVRDIDDVPGEMEQLLEIALTEHGSELSAEIVASIEEAMRTINIEVVMDEARASVDSVLREMERTVIVQEINPGEYDSNIHYEVQMALKEAKAEIEQERAELRERMRHNVQARHTHDYSDTNHSCIIEIEENALEIAVMALEAAELTLETIHIDSTIQISLEHAAHAIEAIPLEDIIENAVEIGVEVLKEIDFDAIMHEVGEALDDIDVDVEVDIDHDHDHNHHHDHDYNHNDEPEEEPDTEDLEEQLRELEEI